MLLKFGSVTLVYSDLLEGLVLVSGFLSDVVLRAQQQRFSVSVVEPRANQG